MKIGQSTGENEGVQYKRCNTFDALKDALRRIKASCAAIRCNLLTALEGLSQRSAQPLFCAGPGKNRAPRRTISAILTLGTKRTISAILTLGKDCRKLSVTVRLSCAMSSHLETFNARPRSPPTSTTLPLATAVTEPPGS